MEYKLLLVGLHSWMKDNPPNKVIAQSIANGAIGTNLARGGIYYDVYSAYCNWNNLIPVSFDTFSGLLTKDIFVR